MIALSSPIGIEALPRDAAHELIDAHLVGVGSLGDRFSAWGPLAVDRPQPGDVDRLLAQLEARAELDRPILVHAILETAQGVANL